MCRIAASDDGSVPVPQMALVAGLLGVALLIALSPLVACVWCLLWDKYYQKAVLVGLDRARACCQHTGLSLRVG